MQRNPEALTDSPFDLLILGGGITGAGVALDAVLRGLRVALIERGDFASGTSSVSSKLVHGGIRYLEHGDFKLVYEALHERRRLLENACHLVHPLRFFIPFYSHDRVPPWKYRLGLTLYDVLAGKSKIQRSQPWSVDHLRREVPGLNAADLLGGASYYDAQMDDARLCLEVIHTAALHGASVANYVEAVDFERTAGALTAVRAIDRVTGRELIIQAREFLNATGPWVDHICRLAGDNGEAHLTPTKGVHLVAPDRGLTSALLLLHPRDGRVFFVIPWMGKTLVGTTDTHIGSFPGELTVTDEDISYLLEGHNRYLAPALEPRHIMGTFVGVRPLIRTSSKDPSAITREFRLFRSPSGLLTVAGGKYTTYRRMAEQIADEIVSRLGKHVSSRTADFRLDGCAEAMPSASVLCQRRGISQALAEHLRARYGRRANEAAVYAAKKNEPVVAGEPDVVGEFDYHREHEMAIYPADFLLRRTRLGLFYPRLLEGPPTEARSIGATDF